MSYLGMHMSHRATFTHLNRCILMKTYTFSVSTYTIPDVLRVVGDPPCRTQPHMDPTSQRSQPSPPRPPHFVASAQTPAGFVLKSLPAYFAQSNNFPEKPSNRQLDGGGGGRGCRRIQGECSSRLPVGAGGGGLFQALK